MYALQPGQQYKAGCNPADILIYGGTAGGGKSFYLILEALRNIVKAGYAGVIFRRETTDLRDGGLWDEAYSIYKEIGCRMNENNLRATYPDGGFVKMTHLQHEKDKYGHQGKQYGFIGFDEIQQFTDTLFFYLQTRNRSVVCNPYTRGTCNPDPDSFLVNGKEGWGSGLISWWIGEDGYPIKERDGVVRYMYRVDDTYDWAATPGRLIDRHYDDIIEMYNNANEGGAVFSWDEFCKHIINSVSFVGSTIYDNKKLLAKDPAYLAKLNNQDTVTRERLLKGNWKIKHEGAIFKQSMFDYYDGTPYMDEIKIFADTAQSTKETAAYTVFLLVGTNKHGIYILDCMRGRFDVDDLRDNAINFWRRHSKPVLSNYPPTTMRVENKSSGIGLNQQLEKAGVPIDPIERGGRVEQGDKLPRSKWERAMNAAFALNGRKVWLPKAPTQYTPSVAWVGSFTSELLAAEKHGDKKGFWDQVDTFSDAVTEFYLNSNSNWVV